MSNLYSHGSDLQLAELRRAARRSTHVHHAQTMLVAASLAAMGVIIVAATLLTQFV